VINITNVKAQMKKEGNAAKIGQSSPKATINIEEEKTMRISPKD
jgi:hypothetical protein